MMSYHEFTEKYADVVEEFMCLESLDKSKDFLLQKGDILLQENASNYLLLASLEDEMNGFHEKMKLVARQSQIISNIADWQKAYNVILVMSLYLSSNVWRIKICTKGSWKA